MPPRRVQRAQAEDAVVAQLKSDLQYLSKTRARQDVSGRIARLRDITCFAENNSCAEVSALLAAAYGAVGRSILGTDGANRHVWAMLGALVYNEISARGNAQLSLAMLRADLLSLFAQISTALGNEGDGSDAAGPSTGGHASAIPVKAQVEIATHMAMMLDRLVFPENSGRAIPLSDVLSALERSQVLEHLSGAILRLAASLPPGLRGTGDPNAAWDRCTGAAELGAVADAEFDWACLSRAIKGLSGVLQLLILCRAEELDALVPAPHPAVRERIPETVHFATQVRPLMSGRSVQLFSVMALQSACLGALAAAAAGRAASATTTTTTTAAPSVKAPAPAPVVPGAHPLRLDADPMPAAGTAFEGFGASIVWAAVAVFHVTSWGCAQLPVAQPPLDYRPAWSAVSPAAPAAAAAAAAAEATAAEVTAAAAVAPCKGSTFTERSSSSSGGRSSGSSRPPLGGPAKGGASAGVVVPFRALPVFDLVRAAWRDLSRPDGNGNIIDRHGVVRMATVLMVRLLMELRPRQAAARLPGLWREVVLPSIAHDISACSILAGELLRLQVHVLLPPPPPPRPPPPPPPQQQQEQQGRASAAGASPPAAAAAAGAAVATSSYSCYSLRCALDAGLLPALERFLRNGRAWAAPDGSSGSASGPAGSSGTPKLTVRSASQLLNRINIVLRYSGLWPAALAYAPPAQVVGLVVTLTAAARRLAALPPMPQELSMAGAMSMYMRGGTSLSILHEQLAALLEQALDLAQAAAEGAGAVAEGAGAAAEGAGEAAAGTARAGESGGAGAPSSPSSSSSRCGYLRLNNALEAPRPAPMQWEWLLTAGNTSGSATAAAAGQRDWLFSFAVQQWLPLLMARISEILLPLDVGLRKVEVPPLPPRAVHLAVLLLRLCAGLLTAAARAAAAEAAEAGAAPRPLPPGGASGRSTSAGTGNGTGHRAEGVRASVAVRASWREAAYELTHGWQLQQLVDYVATHTQLWADESSSSGSGGGGSSSSSGGGGGDGGGGSSCGSSGGGGDQQGEAEGADGDEAEGGGGGGSLESCVLDALEAVWAHRPEWVVQMLSIRLAAATVDYRTPAGGRAAAGSQAAARAGAASKAGVLMPLRQLAAAHGRAELVLVIDEGVAAVSPAAIEKSPTLPPAPTLNCKHQLMRRVLRRRWGEAAQGGSGGGSGGGNGCCLPHAWRLLSPYEVQQRLVTTLAAAADAAVAPAAATSAGAASGTGGGDAGSMGCAASAASAGSAAAAVCAVLCANPDCSSLDGPSALVPPGGGKTCSRCRAARYCCGLCQLQHWREGGHDTSCPGLRG